MRRFIIDRFEGDIAVCETEDGNMLEFVRNQLPNAITEGDCITQDDSGVFEFDILRTTERRKQIKGMMEDLFD